GRRRGGAAAAVRRLPQRVGHRHLHRGGRRRAPAGALTSTLFSSRMATAPSITTRHMTREERVNQRNAVLAGFLGWTLDAFDFFILTLVIEDIARSFFPGASMAVSRPRIAFALTATLAMRPIGALVFGIMAHHFGRRLPLMLNVVFYAVFSVRSGPAPSSLVCLVLRGVSAARWGAGGGVGPARALEPGAARV